MSRKRQRLEEPACLLPDNAAPTEEPVLDNEHHGPRYTIKRLPQGWGWEVIGNRGKLPEELSGMFTSRPAVMAAIHAYEMGRSALYAHNPDKHVS